MISSRRLASSSGIVAVYNLTDSDPDQQSPLIIRQAAQGALGPRGFVMHCLEMTVTAPTVRIRDDPYQRRGYDFHSMSTIPLLSVHLAVAVLESFLYGIYVLLSLFTVYLIVMRHRESLKSVSPVVRSRWPSPVALATLSLFVMVTVSVQHWVLTV
ncbi:hypothetical protein DFH09DRAFT_1370700, partial [Mycena vulgaris]